MGCCKNAEQTNSDVPQSQSSCHCGIKHMLLMLACCLVPIVAVFLLNSNGYEGSFSYLMFLICPLMHLVMMKGMMGKKKEPVSEDKIG